MRRTKVFFELDGSFEPDLLITSFGLTSHHEERGYLKASSV
jgi:hypothetical protein